MKRVLQKTWKVLKKLLIYGFIFSIVSVLLFRFVPIPVTPLMLIRVVEQAKKGETLKLAKDWVPLEEISPDMIAAVMTSEDQRFADHYGFDFESIRKVMKRNKKNRIRGASTISQQTAKNVFLWPGRSWLRKGMEVYFTVLIETLWPKKRIMEVYLNVIEMGDGIYGTEAASRIYFKHPARKLSLSESALIAATLPNPRRWSPVKPTSYIYRKQNWIVRNAYRVKKQSLNL